MILSNVLLGSERIECRDCKKEGIFQEPSRLSLLSFVGFVVKLYCGCIQRDMD